MTTTIASLAQAVTSPAVLIAAAAVATAGPVGLIVAVRDARRTRRRVRTREAAARRRYASVPQR